MTEKITGTFEKWFWVSKESFKSCLKYGIILGVVQVALGLANSYLVIWLGILEPVLLAENTTVTQTFMEGPNFSSTTFTVLVIIGTIISFALTFAIIFFGLKKILQTFPKENKLILGSYIFGINLIVFLILASLIASQLIRPHWLILQVLAVALAMIMAKPRTNSRGK